MRSIFNKCEKDVLVKNVFNDAYSVVKTVYDYILNKNIQNDFTNNITLNNLISAIPSDGVTNSYIAFKNLFDFLNTNKIPFPSGIYGRFVLSGSSNIDIQVSCDFTGIIFDVENWSGRFNINRTKTPIIYTKGDGGIGDSLINDLESSTYLQAGSSNLDGLKDRTELNNSFIKINVDQNFYQYRDTFPKRVIFNHYWNKGFINSPLQYSLKNLSITSIECYPMEDCRTYIKGLTIDLGNNQIKNNFVYIETSLLDIDIKFIQQEFRQNTIVSQLVFLKNFAYINLRLTLENSLQSGALVAYGLGCDDGYDVQIEMQGDGDGWGVTDLNDVARVTYRNSNISRIDFHRPFHEYVKVYDCNIGEKGFTLCGIGDIFIENCTLLMRTGQYNEVSPTLILGRADSGGFIDGDLHIKNLAIGNDVTFLDLLFNQQNKDPSATGSLMAMQGVPVGSPIEFRFFKNIYIDNIYSQVSKTTSSVSIEPTKVVKDGNLLLKPFESFTMVNCKNARINLKFDFDDLVPHYTDNNYDVSIHLDNNNINTLKILETTNNFNVKLSGNNCLPFVDNYSRTLITCAGDYSFKDSQSHSLQFLSDNLLPSINVRANLNNQNTGNPDTTNKYWLEADNAILLESEFVSGNDIFITGLVFTPPVGDPISLSGLYTIESIGSDYLVFVSPELVNPNWLLLNNAYSVDGFTEFTSITNSSTTINSNNIVNIELFNHRFQGRNIFPTSDFILTKPDNVNINMFGGKCDNLSTSVLQNMFARGVNFYGTQFSSNGSIYIPATNPWRLIKPEFFNYKELIAEQSTPHIFTANNVFETTLTQTSLFEVSVNQLVDFELQFVNELSVDGSISAMLQIEGTNNNGLSYNLYRNLLMGYVGKSSNNNNTGEKSVVSRKTLLSRNFYKKYRVTVLLRVTVDGSTIFPISQGNSIFGDQEIKLSVFYY